MSEGFTRGSDATPSHVELNLVRGLHVAATTGCSKRCFLRCELLAPRAELVELSAEISAEREKPLDAAVRIALCVEDHLVGHQLLLVGNLGPYVSPHIQCGRGSW